MPRYSVPSNSATAGQLILPKGDYTFKIGEGKTFLNLDRDTNAPRNWGVAFPLTVVGGEYDGKSIGNQRFYLHSDGAVRMTKGFLLAALGFTTSQTDEAKFNDKYPEMGIDPEAEQMDDVFRNVAGKTIRAVVDVRPNEVREGEVQNSFRWLVA